MQGLEHYKMTVAVRMAVNFILKEFGDEGAEMMHDMLHEVVPKSETPRKSEKSKVADIRCDHILVLLDRGPKEPKDMFKDMNREQERAIYNDLKRLLKSDKIVRLDDGKYRIRREFEIMRHQTH